MTPTHRQSSPYRDSSGRLLTDYPRPSVAVDTAVLTVSDGGLAVVLVEGGRGRQLPGTFLHEGEVLADAVHRSLREKVGIVGLRPEQLRVFDAPDRDDRGWVLSVAHVDVVPLERLEPVEDISVVPVGKATGLLYDHDQIVRIAAEWLRDRYLDQPDPANFLPVEFTLRDLQLVHEAVAGHRFVKDTFRRGMEPRLRETGELARGTVGKPARLWRRT